MAKKSYGKNITSINTPIQFHLPEGGVSQVLNTSAEAQEWFNQNYKDKYSIVDYVPTQRDSEHPVELEEIVVTAPAPKTSKGSARGIDIYSGSAAPSSSYMKAYNRIGMNPIFNSIRVENYQKAMDRNPNFSQDWDMASNISEGVNIMSGGLLNRLSPTQNIGLAIDIAQGDNFWNSWFGNSGIVSDNFTQNHPYWAAGINLVGDTGTYMSALRAINAARPAIVGAKMRTIKLGVPESPPIKPNMRFRLGDVEINDPNLNYRQGKSGLVDDFIRTGVVRTQENPSLAIEKAANPQRKFLLTKSFNNPMFRQGSLWYDGHLVEWPRQTSPDYSDLLVTRQPLQFATKSSGLARFDQSGRRIPLTENQLNPTNTTPYIWKEGYGFKKYTPKPVIQLPIFKK